MNKYVLEAIGTMRSEIKNRDHAASFLYRGSRNAHLAHFVSVAASLRPRSWAALPVAAPAPPLPAL